MEKIKIDPLSFSVLHLFLGYSETDAVLANGTGFIYKYNEKYYIITNWHNVSGKDPFTKEYLKTNAAIPDVLVTWFRDKKTFKTNEKEIIKLYIDEDLQIPIWKEHPIHKDNVDVVAIPLSDDIVSKYYLLPINEQNFEMEFRPEVSDDVFILGFPFESLQILFLPIWKRGSIASDPQIDQKNLPLLFVDTATRPGLSGSPVIYQRIGIHGMEGNIINGNTIFGRIRGFLGIYSGRIGKDENLAQLGLVWKSEIINQILEEI